MTANVETIWKRTIFSTRNKKTKVTVLYKRGQINITSCYVEAHNVVLHSGNKEKSL